MTIWGRLVSLVRSLISCLPLLAVTACPRGDGASRSPADSVSVLVPRAFDDAGATESPDELPVTPPLSELPAAFAALGGRCPDSSRVLAGSYVCDPSGRVIGLWLPVDAAPHELPASAVVLCDQQRPESIPQRSLAIRLEGDRLWIRYVSCGACARVMGHAFVGLLSQLDAEQLRFAQTRVGLPAEPLLTSAEAWRAACPQ